MASGSNLRKRQYSASLFRAKTSAVTSLFWSPSKKAMYLSGTPEPAAASERVRLSSARAPISIWATRTFPLFCLFSIQKILSLVFFVGEVRSVFVIDSVDQDLPWFGSVSGSNDTPFLEQVQQSCGSRVADLQASLQVGGRSLTGFDHGRPRFVVELIVVVIGSREARAAAGFLFGYAIDI